MLENIKEVLGIEIPEFLKNVGHDATSAAKEFESFYEAITPDIEAQIASAAAGDTISLDNLRILRDRLIVKGGTVGLGIIQQERKAVISIVLAVVQTAIKLA